jgi:hypothetical protein
MYGGGPGIGAGIGGAVGGGGALAIAGPGQLELVGLVAVALLITGALFLRAASLKHDHRS